MPLAEACSIEGRTVEAAVESGCVDTVEWCLQRGCAIGAAVETAARLGRVDILKRFNEDDRADTIYTSWSGGPIAAANGGDVATFKWLMEHIDFGDSEDEIVSEALSAAAAGGHTEVLRHWKDEGGGGLGGATLTITTDAAAGGHLNTLQWAMSNGCSWNESTCESAAKGGHVDVLEWCRVNGCPWDPRACAKWAAEVAAECGVTGMLEWCTANG